MKRTRRKFLSDSGMVGLGSAFVNRYGLLDAVAEPQKSISSDRVDNTNDLRAEWHHPSRTYRPHTRWWWPGNAVTREGIKWQLEQMAEQGMGGVEIMTPWEMYTKGNIEFLTPEYLEMVGFAIEQARLLDMEVSLSFGAGWKMGGPWVPPTERSKVLAQVSLDIQGPVAFDRELPRYEPPAKAEYLGGPFHSDAPDENALVAVVAGRIQEEQLDSESLVDLTDKVTGNRLRWAVPEGKWRIMVFRLKYTGEQNTATDNFPERHWVVDHFSKQAMQHYCDYLGGVFFSAFHAHFGSTLDTLFCDSYEIMVLPDTIHWSNTALERFKAYKGYDLTKYLPAIWWEIGAVTPRIRYDINDFLSWLAMDAFLSPFIDWCQNHKISARIQAYYRDTCELIQAAGITPRPEMELTTEGFAIVADPRKAVAAGAHLYGRQIVSAEAYTFIHQERYLTSLQDMKIATDAFLRDGVTQFYNHGYLYSPEMQVAPARDVPWANRISHWNTWWKYYKHLTPYISRCCLLLRQGEFAGDVLLYSPQATVWTKTVRFENNRRIMPYGDIGKTLVANGYDFDPVNDDVLQNRADVKDGNVVVRGLKYRFIVLPNTTCVPIKTMQFFERFVQGGGILIALGQLPASSVGMHSRTDEDALVQQIVSRLFKPAGKDEANTVAGRTYHFAPYNIPDFEITAATVVPFPQTYGPTALLDGVRQHLIDAMRTHLAPDFALSGYAQSDGLTFLHRRVGLEDIYFVTNLQPKEVSETVRLRISGKYPEKWDPMTGEISPVLVRNPQKDFTDIPIHLPAFASLCLIFKASTTAAYAVDSNLEKVVDVSPHSVTGVAVNNGNFWASVVDRGELMHLEGVVSDLPASFQIAGTWKIRLESEQFSRVDTVTNALKSWTEVDSTRHFSGTGQYDIDFDLPAYYINDATELWLDMGHVGDVAEVIVNGINLGVSFMVPHCISSQKAFRAGANHLTVLVTNTLLNYVAGLNELPGVPAGLEAHYGQTNPQYALGAGAWKGHEKGFSPLPPSGLMGPVSIAARRKIRLTVPL